MTANYTTIETTADAGVMTIRLNRPDSRNAFNEQMGVELGTALRMAQRDGAVRCLVLTGTGKAFCSGQDLKEIEGHYREDAEPLDFGAHLRQQYNPIVLRLRSMEKPVIASVNGVAAGAGFSFALAADLRICAQSASFMMAFVHVGLVPDSGGALALLQQVGYAKAAELCFLGERISAERALSMGFVNRVVADDELEAETRKLAARLAALPTRAIGLTKRLLNRAWTAELEQQLEYEAFLQETAGQTADHREGVLAFVEKRKPDFKGC
ncbi:MAG: enoyl-CoA hydratase/isomerase family protein [Planctomycetes bacterium]|nr:enoyl-CoA hydratase/isomerase family protein [Planctomycetota bacterium]